MKRSARILLALWLAAAAVYAQQRGQQQIRPVPPPGIDVPDRVREQLRSGLERLDTAIEKLGQNELLADVLIYEKAVRYALDYDEFFQPEEFAKASTLLRTGEERAAQLARGQAPWTTATGLVVRGYMSKIDGSAQPYGLVIPASYKPDSPHHWRLDAWFHGRGETLSEVNFISGREQDIGQFAPPDTIVLHLYGRYCNANKFAGEVDLFEALDAVKRNFRIDENRILVRGFSMGGASAWQFGTHYAGLWAAVAPGAGFSESAKFLHLDLSGPNAPPWWEQTLFHLYDATDYAVNLSNTATVAYNGDQDRQKQAADEMEDAMAKEGLRLTRVTGPGTGHRYHPRSKIEIDRILNGAAARGRDPYPRKLRFTTWTLAYNRMKWIIVDALTKHWERALVNAEITGESAVDVSTKNVDALTLSFDSGGAPFDLTSEVTVSIDGHKIKATGPASDRSWNAHFRKSGNAWAEVDSGAKPGLHKRHGLQGPVDDAFLDSFIFVTPTGTPADPGVAEWVASEQKHAIAEWRRQFRGDAKVRKDADITEADIASSNLVLWGDPGSNKILAKIAARLPVTWTSSEVTLGDKRFSAKTNAPILVYPNPLNPEKYVVLNSGFTFREFDYLNNARQVPKLPDYAIVDTTTPPDAHYPGKIVAAGFFDEDWGLSREH